MQLQEQLSSHSGRNRLLLRIPGNEQPLRSQASGFSLSGAEWGASRDLDLMPKVAKRLLAQHRLSRDISLSDGVRKLAISGSSWQCSLQKQSAIRCFCNLRGCSGTWMRFPSLDIYCTAELFEDTVLWISKMFMNGSVIAPAVSWELCIFCISAAIY